MTNFEKEFGKLIMQARKELGITQAQLAEALNVGIDSYGRFERGVYKFPLHLLPLVAETLKTSILFDDSGKIHIGEGTMKMNPIFNLAFQDFDPDEALMSVRQEEAQEIQDLYEQTLIAYEKCRAAGWAFTGLKLKNPIDRNQLTADQFENMDNFCFFPTLQAQTGDPLLIDTPQLEASVIGFVCGEWLNLPRFIHDLQAKHGSEFAQFVYKELIYGCLKEGAGPQLYNWANRRKDTKGLKRIFPTLAPWASLISEQAQVSDYVEDYNGLLPDQEWYTSLGLVQEHEYQEFYLNWVTPQGDFIDVDAVEPIYTLEQLMETGLMVLEREYEQVKADFEATLL